MYNEDDKNPKTGLSYKDAGVDIDAGEQLVDAIKSITSRTHRPEVLTGLGGFGALFALPLEKYKAPVLVSGTDGVGTKLKLAIDLGVHDTVGIDLVAMCVNDLVVCGAEPLFFLDYFATGQLDVQAAQSVIKGIGRGCELAGAALIGGETAEMPGMYAKGDYDLAGFCVGIVEKDNIIDGSQVTEGDVLIGLASSGVHSNGFSLVRKVLEITNTPLELRFEGRSIGEILLEPTKIYVKQILKLSQACQIKAIAHITGGGLLENIPRVLPDGLQANLNHKKWEQPAIFDWLQEKGNIDSHEMYRTFNCGIGMVVCVDATEADKALDMLNQVGEAAWKIGTIKKAKPGRSAVNIK